MDDIVGLLDGPRARSAFMLRAVMDPPWSLRILDEAPLTLIAIARGDAWITIDEHEPHHVRSGDIAIVRGPHHYTVADKPTTAPTVTIHPGQHCVAANGESMVETMALGVRTWGNQRNGKTVMLVGAYESVGDISIRLVRALPPLVALRDDEMDTPLIGLLADEIVKDEPGQTAVLDRLLDLLLIAALRTWFARPDIEAPSWYRAQSDPVVGHVLRLMQNNPALPWTVASLAAEAGISRAALARRFHDLVGEPPMTFLTGLRLALAADLLHDPESSLGSVAPQVGYASSFALSTAFKRVRGISPTEHRRPGRDVSRLT